MTKRLHDPEIVKQRLKALRKERGLTQKEVAEELYFSRETITQYECGNRIPDKKNLEILASFYNVDAEYILGETDYKNRFDRWNHFYNAEKLQKEVEFWQTGIRLGLFPDFKSEEEYSDFIDYLTQYEKR